jgi:hypothetical protein
MKPNRPNINMNLNNKWTLALELDNNRKIISGSNLLLSDAIRRGADLRIYTEFRHNEHIDTKSVNNELIKEVADFRITYLMEDRWVAGIINLRQPVDLPANFGPRPSMSFFLYNQDGGQAIARPYLDGLPANGDRGPSPTDDHTEMPRYHEFEAWDKQTNAPSSNFVYDFETYRFLVCDDWSEVYTHDENGQAISGSLEALEKAFERGMEVKAGIKGLCNDLNKNKEEYMEHEVFIQCGSCYYYTETKFFSTVSQPVVRVRPAIPLKYSSGEWDFGWLIPQSDGWVARWLINPYDLKFHRSYTRHAIRWLVR